MMSEDHRPDHPPEACEATVHESSSRPRGQVQQTIQKISKGFTKKFSKPFKRSRNRIPAVQNVDQGSSSNQNVEDTSYLHPSTGDKHPASSEIPSVCINQGSSGEPASEVLAAPPSAKETRRSASTDAELQAAHEALEHMRTLGGPAQSATSAASNASASLTAADNFSTTYLQPLKIFDTAIEKIANVHPYAKMSLGVLSAAAKIILAQAERDESVQRLLQKLDQVYGFIIQDDNLFKVESMSDVVRKIAQQTLECARFIRDYSETKSFC
ncbi:uncharacterized protein EDB93DRAFT_1337981 [Suillus bovinus]|uniref:uncharacterized protein n=1 Tax=Suillus bovinus TaxID=48563 RepID=UPI001B872519|nr:uncharacterized protein EDB93DRAFT_1337981 [Suillus bovinus]KAG2144689.1 hypothetical protein EDB93DRAFT_1337981 [Suillus bovinus]